MARKFLAKPSVEKVACGPRFEDLTAFALISSAMLVGKTTKNRKVILTKFRAIQSKYLFLSLSLPPPPITHTHTHTHTE
jgi:hypothetical protein